jgi:hypothetical protein
MPKRTPMRRLAVGALTLSAALSFSLISAGAADAATTPTPPFTQCPAIGNSPSCAILIELTDSGTNILADSTVGPFDGVEDTLVGVQNNSTQTVTRITLSGSGTTGLPVFGFEGDGLCAGYTGSPAGCPFGITGYEGPGTSFENISADFTTGDVVFNPGLAPGASGYFSLEDLLNATSITTSNTAVSYTGLPSVQYSDPLVLSGHLQTAPGGVAIAGETIGFVLGTDTKSAGPTDASGNASAASYNELQQPGSVTTVDVSFAGDATTTPPLVASNSSSPFTIAKEDCTLAYTGDVQVNAANMTTLSAQFGEPDTTPGVWTGKDITFTVTDAALVSQTFTVQTNAAGVASTSQTLVPNVYTVGVSFPGDAFYNACSTTTDTIVTVQAANAKITGGGWISQGTGNTNFGFNVIRDVTGLKGQLQVRIRNGKDRFHSTSVLTLNSSGNAGTWTGTGRWNGVTGYTFTVSVVDNGTSGKKGDTISILIKSPANATVFTTSGAVPLKGGNIVVH